MKYLALLSAILIGAAIFFFLAPNETTFGMFSAEKKLPTSRFVLSFSATLAGVVLGSMYRQLRQLQEAGATNIDRTFFSRAVTSIDMWLGFVSSPIVFALLLKSTAEMNLAGVIVVALENGFCCLILVNSFLGRAANQGPSANPTPATPTGPHNR
jgi:hypothetical protein